MWAAGAVAALFFGWVGFIQASEGAQADYDLYERCYGAGPLSAKIIAFALLALPLACLGGYGLFRRIADNRAYGLPLFLGCLCAAGSLTFILLVQSC